MSEVVTDFVRREIIKLFGPQDTIVSNNVSCFTARSVTDFLSQHDIRRKAVLAHA